LRDQKCSSYRPDLAGGFKGMAGTETLGQKMALHEPQQLPAPSLID
jgi:hypothetical protein